MLQIYKAKFFKPALPNEPFAEAIGDIWTVKNETMRVMAELRDNELLDYPDLGPLFSKDDFQAVIMLPEKESLLLTFGDDEKLEIKLIGEIQC